MVLNKKLQDPFIKAPDNQALTTLNRNHFGQYLYKAKLNNSESIYQRILQQQEKTLNHQEDIVSLKTSKFLSLDNSLLQKFTYDEIAKTAKPQDKTLAIDFYNIDLNNKRSKGNKINISTPQNFQITPKIQRSLSSAHQRAKFSLVESQSQSFDLEREVISLRADLELSRTTEAHLRDQLSQANKSIIELKEELNHYKNQVTYLKSNLVGIQRSTQSCQEGYIDQNIKVESEWPKQDSLIINSNRNSQTRFLASNSPLQQLNERIKYETFREGNQYGYESQNYPKNTNPEVFAQTQNCLKIQQSLNSSLLNNFYQQEHSNEFLYKQQQKMDIKDLQQDKQRDLQIDESQLKEDQQSEVHNFQNQEEQQQFLKRLQQYQIETVSILFQERLTMKNKMLFDYKPNIMQY